MFNSNTESSSNITSSVPKKSGLEKNTRSSDTMHFELWFLKNRSYSTFCVLSMVFYEFSSIFALFTREKCFLNVLWNFFFQKMTISGQKVLPGTVKFISVDPKEAFIDIYLTGIQAWFSNPLFILEWRK